MKRQITIMISIAAASFLIGTIFSVMAIDGENPFTNIWQAVNGQQERIDSLNAKVAELETKLNALNATKLGKPDYDSGWISIGLGEVITLNHGLGTADALVYVLGKYNFDGTAHQWMYGGGFGDNQGAVWFGLTDNQIKIERFVNDVRVPEGQWNQVRVMLWKIAAP